jgi:hypothetical protein
VSEESARPQDVGRPHRRRLGEVSPEVASILERYRGAMRDELAMLLETLGARKAGLLPDVAGELVVPLAERMRLWDLAIKLGRELAGGPGDASVRDPGAVAIERTDPTLIRPARPAPRLKARERRSLGG